MANTTFDERTVLTLSRLVVPADGIALLPLYTIATGDSRIDAILCSNRDGIAHVVSIVQTTAGVVTQLGSVSIPAGQGYAGTPSIDLLASILPATQVGLNLKAGDLIGVQLAVAVVATFDLSVTATGGRF